MRYSLLLILLLLSSCQFIEPLKLLTCYDSNNKIFFWEVGGSIRILTGGGIMFRFSKEHTRYKEGYIYFTPSWNCVAKGV